MTSLTQELQADRDALSRTPAPYALHMALWLAQGSAAVRSKVISPVLAAEQIVALAITARCDDCVLNGEKAFITSGMRADWITVAVQRTF